MPKLRLESCDGESFVVDENVACQSRVIRTMIVDLHIGQDDDEPVSLPNVNGHILRKVIQWCVYHRDDPSDEQTGEDGPHVRTDSKANELCLWDKEFFKVDQGTLLEIIMAANYLDIPRLLDAGCRSVAMMMTGKKTEELRNLFNIKNDFTPAEEEHIRQENEWCEEGSENM